MNINIKCPGCGQALAVPMNLAGRQATCPKCKSAFLIPTPQPPRPLPMASPLNVPAPLPARSGPPPLPRSAAAISSAQGPELELDSLGLSSSSAAYGSPAAQMPGTGKNRQAAKTTWIVGAIGACVLLVAAAVGGWMMFGATASIGDDAKYLPDGSNFVLTLDVKALVKSGIGRQLKDQFANLDQLSGSSKIKIEDIGRVTLGGRVEGQKFCSVAHFSRPVAIDELWQSGQKSKSTVGSYTLYSLEHGKMAAVQINPQLIVFGVSAEVRKILARNGPPKLPEALTAAMSETDFGKPIAVAAAMSGLAQAAESGGGAGQMAAYVDQLRGIAAYAEVGDNIRLNAAIVCKDSTAADNIRKQIEGAKAMFASMNPAGATAPNAGPQKILNSLTVSSSGATVRASVTIDADTLSGPIMAARAAADRAASANRSLQPQPSKPRLRKLKKPKDTSANSN